MELNSLKCYSTQTVDSIELKFGMYIIGHGTTYCVEFGEFRINIFLQEFRKEFLCITALLCQIVRSTLLSKWCFRLGSILVCTS